MVTGRDQTPRILQNTLDYKSQKPAQKRGFLDSSKLTVLSGRVVAHRGFEPLISALRGRCPRPLDECALTF
jgi:hypothetical protein